MSSGISRDPPTSGGSGERGMLIKILLQSTGKKVHQASQAGEKEKKKKFIKQQQKQYIKSLKQRKDR